MKYDISKQQMTTEFASAGKFDVVSYDRETGNRISTYGGLNAHLALKEILNRLSHGARFLVFQFPSDLPLKTRFSVEQEGYFKGLTSPYLACLPNNFGRRA